MSSRPQGAVGSTSTDDRDVLGRFLVERRILSAPQLELARKEQKRLGESLGRVLIRLRFSTEERLADAIAEVLHLQRVDLSATGFDLSLVGDDVPREFARKYGFVPIARRGEILDIAMADPFDVVAADVIQQATGCVLKIRVATESEITSALSSSMGAKDAAQNRVEKVIDRALGENKDQRAAEEDVGSAIVELVDMTVAQGVQEGATDIHIEPEENLVRVRYRIDGMLHQGFVIPKQLQNAMISRVKVLSDLDISERRIPQDGRFQVKLEGKEADVRVSLMPSAHGENIVMRLLDKNAALLDLTTLGFPDGIRKSLLSLLSAPYGIVLVTGPTGSGKSTTLYAALSTVNSMEKKVVTVEDPIEYQVPLIRQSQVNAQVGFTFASGLRAILRQDPDIIMVGEIRDLETAQISIRAGLTGHLVLSTLHTNTAAGAFSRLADMGVDIFLINSSLLGVLAQRLVRRLCSKCQTTRDATEAERDFFRHYGEEPPEQLAHGTGCHHCRTSGYRGRMGLYELYVPNDDSRKILQDGGGEAGLTDYAVARGMRFMIHDGLQKVRLGVTTIEELQRVLLTSSGG